MDLKPKALLRRQIRDLESQLTLARAERDNLEVLYKQLRQQVKQERPK